MPRGDVPLCWLFGEASPVASFPNDKETSSFAVDELCVPGPLYTSHLHMRKDQPIAADEEGVLSTGSPQDASPLTALVL